VSDRWHVVKNLAACVSVQIAKTLAQLRRAEERRPARTQAVQQAQQARAAERMARYERILELQKHGMKSGEIARTLRMSQRTLQRWIATGNIPYSRRKRQRASLIDPDITYLFCALAPGLSHGSTTRKGTESEGIQRIATRDLPLSRDTESVASCPL
jgi:DNA-binding transcriptional regulator YiaG